MKTEIEKLTSGVDWLTATTNDDAVGKVWYDVFVSLAKITDPKGVDTKSGIKLSRYTGVSAPKLFWGMSGRLGFILIARSTIANMAWLKIAMTARKVTRLDLAVTVYLKKQETGLAARHYARAGKGENEQRKYGVVLNSRGARRAMWGQGNPIFMAAFTTRGQSRGRKRATYGGMKLSARAQQIYTWLGKCIKDGLMISQSWKTSVSMSGDGSKTGGSARYLPLGGG